MTTSARRKLPLPGGDTSGASSKLGLTTCGYCHAGNGADRRFCGECGQPLWEKCPACQVECRSGEAFCGGCGIHLREFLKQQVDAAEAALVKASACQSPADINEAIRTLRSVRLAEHRELTSLSERIAAELSRLLQFVEQQTHDVEASLVRVRELIAASAFSDAVRLIEQLPKDLRTDESDKLLAAASSKQRETMALKAEIRAAIEKKQLLALGPKIERLLVLQPDAEGIRRLAGQVRDRLLVAANKKLAANEYNAARELVACVPACAIDENT
ncbi:MAG: zinc ribbon domain-containing protein, partial [Pirellulaceae bacterium]